MSTLKKITDTINTIRKSEAFKQATLKAENLLSRAIVESKKLSEKAVQSAKGVIIQKEGILKTSADSKMASPVKKVEKSAETMVKKDKKKDDLLSKVAELKKM